MLASMLLQTPVSDGWLDRFVALSQGAREALAGVAVLAAILLVGWFIAWAVDRLWNRRWLDALRRALQVRALKFGLMGVVFLNWVYLWLALR